MHSLTRYNPSREFARFSRDLDRLMGDFFPGRQATPQDLAAAVWTPRVDVIENEQAFVLSFDLPGVPKDQVKITVEGGHLKVSGERTFNREASNDQIHRVERAYGTFTRAFRLGPNVNADAIEAVFEHGVLTITLPKAETVKPREIAVR